MEIYNFSLKCLILTFNWKFLRMAEVISTDMSVACLRQLSGVTTRFKYDQEQISGMKTKIYLEAGLWTVPGAIQAPYSLRLPNQVVPHHLVGKTIIPIDKHDTKNHLQVRVYPVGISLPAFPKLLILAHPSLLLPVVIVHTEVQNGRRRHVRLNLLRRKYWCLNFFKTNIFGCFSNAHGTYGWTFWERNICLWTFLNWMFSDTHYLQLWAFTSARLLIVGEVFVRPLWLFVRQLDRNCVSM